MNTHSGVDPGFPLRWGTHWLEEKFVSKISWGVRVSLCTTDACKVFFKFVSRMSTSKQQEANHETNISTKAWFEKKSQLRPWENMINSKSGSAADLRMPSSQRRRHYSKGGFKNRFKDKHYKVPRIVFANIPNNINTRLIYCFPDTGWIASFATLMCLSVNS